MDKNIERGVMLTPWGPLASRVAALLRARPQFAARLSLARPAATHAYATFLLLAPEAVGPDDKVATVLDQHHPRDLLRLALPECSDALYPTLDRLQGAVRPAEFYHRLDAVLHSPFARVVQDAAEIDDRRLIFAERLARCDPAVGQAWRALDHDEHLANCLHTIAVLLRANGLPEEVVPSADAGIKGVLRWLVRNLGRITAPPPPFCVPPGYARITTVNDLRKVGRQFNNCLGALSGYQHHHWFDMLTGARVFLARENPALCISLRLVGPNLYYLSDVLGPHNASPPTGSRTEVRAALQAVGARLVPLEPTTAFSRILNHAQPPAEPDLGEVEDRDAGEDLAA